MLSDGRVTGILRNAGYLSGRKSYCIVVAQSADPTEMLNPDRARRLADAIERALSASSIKHLVDLRDNKAIAVCSGIRRVSGWTRSQEQLVTEVVEALALLGPSVLIGISNEVPATGKIPTAFKQAHHALNFADRGNRVAAFRSIPLQQLLLTIAGDDIQSVLPSWASEFSEADKRAKGALSATLEAYADADMNLLKTAETLEIHPNTVYARFQKINDITGLEARSYHALTDLLLVKCKNIA